MRKLTTHSKNGLFLMEMIFSLLILAFACTACVQIFAAARSNRLKAREWNHIQELTTTVGEILEGSDGKAETVLAHLPKGSQNGSDLSYFYSQDWQDCLSGDATYEMRMELSAGDGEKAVKLSFLRTSGEKIYDIVIRYPLLDNRKEAS